MPVSDEQITFMLGTLKAKAEEAKSEVDAAREDVAKAKVEERFATLRFLKAQKLWKSAVRKYKHKNL